MKSIYKRFTKRTLLSILIVHISMLSFAATYYVTSAGSNSNSGLTEELAWQNLTNVINHSFSAGDTIKLRCGDTFTVTESLYIYSSGSVGNPIVFTSYGTGSKPKISAYGKVTGWQIEGNWDEYSTGIWRMINTDPIQHRLWINGKEQMFCATTTLTSTQTCTYSGGYLYLKSATNPATTFSSINIAARSGISTSIKMTDISNVELIGIATDGGVNGLRFINCKNILVDGCDIGNRTHQFGLYVSATAADSSTNIIVKNCKFITGDSLYYTYYRGSHATSDAIWLGQGSVNCKVYNNYFDNWSHGAYQMISQDINYPYHDNEFYGNFVTGDRIDYSRGFVAYFNTNGYNNSIHDNTIVNTTIQSQCEGRGLKVYNNIIDNVSETPYSDKLGEQNGLAIEGTSTSPSYMEIYNNTITNCDYTGIRILGGTIDKSYNNIHDNNIFNCGNGATHHYGYQMIIFSGTGVHDETYFDNHLSIGETTNLISYNGTAYTINGFNSADTNGDVISDNNSTMTYGNYTTNANDLIIEHNETQLAKIISVAQPMVDQKGNKYSNSVTLQPYTSVILMKDSNPTIISKESIAICDGANYNGWTTSGIYERTLKAISGSDSIVTTNLTVNPNYSITEDVTITEGETYQEWSTSGQYSRTFPSVTGCDSTVITNLTVEKIITETTGILPTHYIPVWQGENGLNHMNIMVVSATLDDISLNENDEIAVFDGSICVGSMKLTQAITTDNNTFLTIPASQDDGSSNGFTDQDTIIFKVWDDQNQTEILFNDISYRNDISSWITSGKFAAGSTSVVELVSFNEYTQTIELVTGYNLISTYVSPLNSDAGVVTQSLCEAGSLIKIQDESGNSLEDWGTYGGWINQLGTIQNTEGYQIKVANNCTLNVTGRTIALPLDIPLKAGWNIISFPRTDLVDAINIIQPLIDQNTLIKVQDETGNSIENWGIFGGWKNGIGNFIPGKAYKVKLSADATLTIQEYYTKSAVILANRENTSYFSSEIKGNGYDHMNINIVGLQKSGISVGDELAAFDGTICVGSLKITENDLIEGSASLIASFSTDNQNNDGFTEGHVIELSAWSQMSGDETKVQTDIVSGQLQYLKKSSVLVKLKSLSTAINSFEDQFQIDVFPNPSQGRFTVRFSEMPEAGSKIDILDLSGRTIASRMITEMTEEFNLDHQSAGIYLVKSIINSNETIHKLIVN